MERAGGQPERRDALSIAAFRDGGGLMKILYVGLMVALVGTLATGGLMRWFAFMNNPKLKPFRSVGDKWGFWLSVGAAVGMVALTVLYENLSP
ncbi:hypothetical protein JR065_18775 [Xanthomonas sp. AmX2]|uniref:hypothetical protein n=1 Tax=Xanthomonas sp. TaxID=29446 RepID=UPI001980511E|nr:hypothetical protein [Xanthomonas sp.]MBN6152388.1 hypothetical protein [Xanthomonas sp.]